MNFFIVATWRVVPSLVAERLLDLEPPVAGDGVGPPLHDEQRAVRARRSCRPGLIVSGSLMTTSSLNPSGR